jgi:hypothetical protein
MDGWMTAFRVFNDESLCVCFFFVLVRDMRLRWDWDSGSFYCIISTLSALTTIYALERLEEAIRP